MQRRVTLHHIVWDTRKETAARLPKSFDVAVDGTLSSDDQRAAAIADVKARTGFGIKAARMSA